MEDVGDDLQQRARHARDPEVIPRAEQQSTIETIHVDTFKNQFTMKKNILGLLLVLFSIQLTFAQTTPEQQEIIELSKAKWQWMADKEADKLAELFDDKSVFVHMGGAWGKEQEINIIRGGGIWYKKADVHEVSVEIIDNTAILLNRITLVAEVGGNEVVNPFMVTEVYVKKDGVWKMGSLSFTRLMTPGGN
jgi:hypothetical protein